MLNPAKVFIFDVDGVIVDSTDECLVVAWNANQELQNQTRFIKSPDKAPQDFQSHFRQIRPYIRAMDEYLVVFENPWGKIISQSTFEHALSKNSNTDLNKFGNAFFKQRNKLKSQDYSHWLKLHRIYPGIINLIKQVKTNYITYIVTGKDRESVLDFFREFQIEISPDHIFDKSIAKNKMAGIETIAKKETVQLNQIIFLDDNITHLITPHNNQVQTIMASWGYAQSEHVKLAEKNRIPITSISKLYDIITTVKHP